MVRSAKLLDGGGSEPAVVSVYPFGGEFMATNEDLIVKCNELLEELANEKRKAKEKEAKEAWTKTAAISIVVIAVFGGTAAQRSGVFSTRGLQRLNQAIFHQVAASDQWSFFQAKSTKANLYEIGAEEARLVGTDAARAKAESLAQKAQQYRKEQEPLKAEAERFEGLREEQRKASEKSGEAAAGLGLSVIAYQVAVALGSICVVTKRKMLWYSALVLGGLATAQMFYVLFTM